MEANIVRAFIIFLSLSATCGFGYIAFTSQTILSFSAFIASLVTLLTIIVNKKKTNNPTNNINQSVGDSSSVFQAGRDINYQSKNGEKK